MREGTCSSCGTSLPLRSGLVIQSRFFCRLCKDKHVAESRGQITDDMIGQAVDPTICEICGRDNGSIELLRMGGMPLCESCTLATKNKPFPGWIKAAFVLLLGLLAFSLVHGAKYFVAGKEMVQAERLMEQKKYSEAVPKLEKVLEIAPDSEKVLMMIIKAAILTGDYGKGFEIANKHSGKNFENKMITEVNALLDRANAALDKAEKAGEEYEKGNHAGAVNLMRQAARQYPECDELVEAADSMEADVAFDKKDYARFIELSEKHIASNPENPENKVLLISILSIKYVLKKDPAIKQQALEAIEGARGTAEDDPEESFEQFVTRILHRMDKGEIISKKEYYGRISKKGESK